MLVMTREYKEIDKRNNEINNQTCLIDAFNTMLTNFQINSLLLTNYRLIILE